MANPEKDIWLDAVIDTLTRTLNAYDMKSKEYILKTVTARLGVKDGQGCEPVTDDSERPATCYSQCPGCQYCGDL